MFISKKELRDIKNNLKSLDEDLHGSYWWTANERLKKIELVAELIMKHLDLEIVVETPKKYLRKKVKLEAKK